MISVSVRKLVKKFDTTIALESVDLSIEPGELFFLLGPSGCGKTTLLRTIAGFYIPDEGQVFFGDKDVTHQEPYKRNAGMVFQSYALWPHMTVAQNVSFGLEQRKLNKKEIEKQVLEALDAVGMQSYSERKPNQLSGGQQQRIALTYGNADRHTHGDPNSHANCNANCNADCDADCDADGYSDRYANCDTYAGRRLPLRGAEHQPESGQPQKRGVGREGVIGD